MGFWQDLRKIKWDLTNRRFAHLQAMLAPIPSRTGAVIRFRFYKRWLKSVGEDTEFLANAYIRNPQNMSIGKRSVVGLGVRIQAGGGLTIGDCVLIGPGAMIWTSNHLFDDPDVPIRDQGHEQKEVVIGDDCWIGANAFIMPGVVLGKGCVVSAGAVVGAKSYKDYVILIGNPARVIGYRGGRQPAPGGGATDPVAPA